MRSRFILLLYAASAAACDGGVSVRTGVSVESEFAVQFPSTNADPLPASRSLAPSTPAPGGECSEHYDPCVPVDDDVDCAGGRGNGPSYVSGPVKVVGRDEYGLDSDDDGIGCE